jgi:hypothetical protein
VLAQSKYAKQSGFPRYAVVGAVTAIELIIRFMLVRPLLQGAFLSDNWAQLLVKHITAGKTVQERDILPSMLEIYGIRIKELKLSDGSTYWKTLIETVIRKRNRITHDGETATPQEAEIALECVAILRDKVVSEIARKMGFTLDATRCWHKAGEAGQDSYDPTSPFR